MYSAYFYCQKANDIHKMISFFQLGYKDGKHDGRESQFQIGFDKGYQQGFQNGFLLGNWKGSLSVKQSNTDANKLSVASTDLISQRSSRGQCILCKNPSLKDDSIEDIVEKQNAHMKTFEETLQSRDQSS